MQHENASNTLLSILDEFGITVTPVEHWEQAITGLPTEVEFRRHNSSQTYTVLSPLRAPDGLARMDRLINTSRGANERRLIFVADRLNARTMTAYRGRKIDYVDLAGNALIRFGDVYIDVQGRTLDNRKATGKTRHAPVNLFSARRAQVIFALIVWPELLALPTRYTSVAAGVSIGIAFQTIQLLRESGYVIGESNPSLARKSELVDRWTDAFATGLKNKLLLGRYRGEHFDELRGGSGNQWLVSGESAVPSLLRPTTLTMYVEELDPGLIAANRWRRDGHPNIELRKKFWSDPRRILHEDRGLEYRSFETEVPALLIYADLISSGDGRQREAAHTFRKSRHELVDG